VIFNIAWTHCESSQHQTLSLYLEGTPRTQKEHRRKTGKAKGRERMEGKGGRMEGKAPGVCGVPKCLHYVGSDDVKLDRTV